jgi:hypothetical protein
MDALLEIFFLPPMAIARVGSSDTPVEAYAWKDDRSGHGGTQTVVTPAPTFEVLGDGSVRAYMPDEIHFKEPDGRIRPVAPFFELWGRFQSARSGEEYEQPLTSAALRVLGVRHRDLRFEITATNQKAARRAQTPACGFTARVAIAGNDHRVHDLDASSRHTPGETPLVLPGAPIRLGRLQVTRPKETIAAVGGESIDLSVVRVRFTPPHGNVYGPPTAVTGPASPVPPGVWDAPQSDYGNVFTIVDPQNRFLSADTAYSNDYAWGTGRYEDPQPQDGYDGADVGTFRAWGTVDDTCDAILQAELTWQGQRFQALARIFTGPPDFSPDRRPFFSIADDLADRDLPAPPVTEATEAETIAEIVDLFRRAFEAISQFNVDGARFRGLFENRLTLAGGHPPFAPSLPAVDGRSMTAEDTPYVDRLPPLVAPQATSINSNSVANDRLPYSGAARFVHAQLMDEVVLMDFLARRPDHVRRLVRPPIGSFAQLPVEPAAESNAEFRDPRVVRDMMHDMRMPPYMRDANYAPLSLSRRQYRTLMSLLDRLESLQAERRR